MASQLLESFDAPPPPSDADRAYERGYAEGHAAAATECAENQALLTDELVQNLKDLEFRYAEVRADVLGAISPLFAVICEKVFPEIVDRVFAFQVAEILRDAAVSQMPASLSLAVNPAQFAAVSAAAEELSPAISVYPDESLGRHAMILGGPPESRLFDPDHLVAQIARILDALARPHERKATHG